MLRDFDLITHSFPGEIDIYPIADVHLGAVEHCETEWQAFLKKVENDNAYLILAGDLLNNSTRGTRFANPFDEVLRPREAKKRMAEYLEPVKDRILVLVDGNHEARTTRDTDQSLTYDICAKLNIEHLYRENIAFMYICVGERNAQAASECQYSFVVQHGSGGGIYTGAAVNRNERMGNVVDGLDCYIAGHVHKGVITKPAKIVFDGRHKVIRMSHYVVVSCVSWLNYGGYAAKGQLLPAHVCDPQRLHLVADRYHKKIITTW